MNKPSKLKRVVIKEELVLLTGNYIKAVILQQLLYWSERVWDFDKFVEEELTRATMHSENEKYDFQKSHGWVYKTAEDLIEETMLQMSGQTMRKYLKELVDDGFIEERRNPKYKWDQTKQYRVDIVKTQKALLKKGFALEGYKIKLPISKTEIGDSDSENRNLKVGGTIPEITTEITTEIKKDVEKQTSSLLMQESDQKDEDIKLMVNGDYIGVPPNLEDSEHLLIDAPISDTHLGHLLKGSKRKAKFEEKFKNKSVPDIIAWDKERVSKEKRIKGKASVKQSSPCSKIIITRFEELYKEFFTETVPMIEIKHKKLVKNLLEHYGFEYTQAMLEEMFIGWAEFKRNFKIKTTANLSLLYVFRDYFHERIRNKVGDDRPKDEF